MHNATFFRQGGFSPETTSFFPQTSQTDADLFSAKISEFCGKINYRITFVNTGALSFSTVT